MVDLQRLHSRKLRGIIEQAESAWSCFVPAGQGVGRVYPPDLRALVAPLCRRRMPRLAMISSRCRPSEPRLPSAAPDSSKSKSPRPRRQSGGWVLVAVAGIVLFSGSILAVLLRQYSGLMLLPPSFKRLPLDEAGAARLLREHRFVLMGGPHRGGTTLLWRLLAEHPLVSAFAENADTDYGEGAFLQTVLPRYGVGEEGMRQAFPSQKGLATGLGRFAFAPDAHLTEASRLNSNHSRVQLLSEWGYHWNLSRPVLIEKTPTNILTSRLLQA